MGICTDPKFPVYRPGLELGMKGVLIWRPEYRPNAARGERHVTISCGVCPGCKMTNRHKQGVQTNHEGLYHEHSCFITLTYAPEHLPPHMEGQGGLVCHKDQQLFMKKLRKATQEGNNTIRFLRIIHYGGLRKRPHAHALLFGIDLTKLRDIREDGISKKGGLPMFRSEWLEEELWGYGIVKIQLLGPGAAMYATAYALRADTYIPWITLRELEELCNQNNGEDRYGFENYVTSLEKQHNAQAKRERQALIRGDEPQGYDVRPNQKPWDITDYWPHKIPFGAHITRSTNPGLGTKWIEQYNREIYPDRALMVAHSDPNKGSFRAPIPGLYNKWEEKNHPEVYAQHQAAIVARMEDKNLKMEGTRIDENGLRLPDHEELDRIAKIMEMKWAKQAARHHEEGAEQ